jgi:hypothetical protein
MTLVGLAHARHGVRVGGTVAVVVFLVTALTAAGAPGRSDDKGRKASLSVKVNPVLAFSPARVVATAELRGGTNTDEELYCPEVEWEWGDGTFSSATADCEPFEAGKSEVKRRYTAEHTYQQSGSYRLQLSLKRGKKSVVAGNTNLTVKPGVHDLGDTGIQ